jgi:large subunit ribosomal protein L25
MKIAHTFTAEAREGSGKGAARALRRNNRIPAIVYGHNDSPVKISLPIKDITLAYQKGSFFNRIVDINVGGKKINALPRDIQMHPVTDVIEHADFQQVDDKTPVHVMVPVKVIGADKSAGLKRGGVLNIVRHEIEFICLPAAIPAHIEIDVKDVNIGGSIHIKDVVLPKDVTPAIKRNFTIITVAGRREEEETPVAAAATAEGAAAPAAGAAAPAAGAKAGAAAPAAAAAKPAAKK